MGNFFGAWKVTLPDGTVNVIVCKAYSLAKSIAKRRFPNHTTIELINSNASDGEVVVKGDDGIERLG